MGAHLEHILRKQQEFFLLIIQSSKANEHPCLTEMPPCRVKSQSTREKGLDRRGWQAFQYARYGSPVLGGWIEKQRFLKDWRCSIRINSKGRFGSARGESPLVLFRASEDRPGTDADVAHGCGDPIASVSHGFQDGGWKARVYGMRLEMFFIHLS
ncbi:MAG TPA: hypothetical protein VFC44_13830 [Candidatus Saccharimonadales bacterium]|nr:hypothetical protein [Candidatus Saccharimonadales bacterium]